VFLDEPYPENLHVVAACLKCNSSASSHEEYVACLVECVLAGSADPAHLRREKIRRGLEYKPLLQSRLEQACHMAGGRVSFRTEPERVKRVVVKLARGHAAFELNEPQLRRPSTIQICPLPLLPPEDVPIFEGPLDCDIWPEVGTRAMQRLAFAASGVLASDWIEAQPGRYRYLTWLGREGTVLVRGVIGEYLWFQVLWSQPHKAQL
jgi:hypothetical protein